MNNNKDENENEETLSSEVDLLLLQGLSMKDIESRGYSKSLIRQRKRRLIKKGQLQPDGSTTNGKTPITLTIKEKEQVVPEFLQQQIGELYDGDERTKKVFMAGAGTVLLGMRLFSESWKPMLALMQTYQQGQAEAAKQAQGGSEDVAQQTIVSAMPYFKDMITEVSRNQAVNPLQSMMVRAIEPIFQNVIGNVMGGMFSGIKKPQGQQGQGQGLPPGWSQGGE